jgi:hypothetical protein
MSTNNDNCGSAFPVLERGGQGLELTDTGMTRRDYIAAKALQGLLANSNIQGNFRQYAHDAYVLADAMLKARQV